MFTMRIKQFFHRASTTMVLSLPRAKLTFSTFSTLAALALVLMPQSGNTQDYTDAEKRFFSDGHPVIDNIYGSKTCLTCGGPPSAECYPSGGGGGFPQSQFMPPTTKQQQGQAIGNLFMNAFNKVQEGNRASEERKERLRREEEQERREVMSIQAEDARKQAAQQPSAAYSNSTPPPRSPSAASG